MTAREETFLSDDLLRQLMGVGEIDLLIGIHTGASGEIARPAADSIEEQCLRNFVRDRVALLTVNGSHGQEDTATDQNDAFVAAEGKRGVPALRTIHKLSAGFEGKPENGTLIRTLLAVADLLRARVAAVVTPSSPSVPPEWLANLVRPIRRDQFDFVAPLYRRHWNQGLLTRSLLYPMTRALFGYRIREPYSEDFAVSGRLATQCLDRDEWREEAVAARPEAWLAAEAISAGAPICQAFVGTKEYPSSVSGATIVQAIRQTVGALFWLMETHSGLWLEIKESKGIHTVGPDHEVTMGPVPIDRQRLQEMFRTGVGELEPILGTILSADTHSGIQRIAANEDRLEFPQDLWVRTVYEFAAAYHHQVIDRDHVVQAIVPLYRGMAGAYLEENGSATPDIIEAKCERLCVEFERQKPFLVEQWSEKTR
jgi:glucosylglycerate synthase